MSDETPKGIEHLTSEEFRQAHHVKLEYANPQSPEPTRATFVLTRISRIDYAVNIDTGMAHTRPQLIDIYKKFGATYLIRPMD